ncbi:uncharacterized protein EV154DRAFT_416776 [Mucor mucedo]|uniref:uncharacterized protein n=1 Tax=Mucor mucedo TaxID=29922 RepID=UPI0022203C04|nr:uncharacterized protein EV154DRAFT_416776 [Mucor mucedo]KAI7893502.1 hypothetical protein EV154DRAFT_416776 [Mucor mucedo]
MPDEKKPEEPQYAAEQYAVNDYAVPADYVVPPQQDYYTETEYTDYNTAATAAATTSTGAQDYSDPNAQYYDPNQYYYDYNTGTYIDANAVADTTNASYNYDQYYAQQPAYYDPSYSQGYHTMGGSGVPLPESVTAIQSAATAHAAAKYNPTPTSAYNTSASQAPKVYYPSTANANNPIGPIIITKSGYAGPTGSTSHQDGSVTTTTKKKTKKVVRAAGGEVWEDHSLEDWDDNDFRLFAGDLGNEVTEEILYKAFSKYPSLLRTRVVRDTRTMKSKGFGFISFKDPDDFVKAWREMNGKYVGNRPIKLRKSTWKERNVDVRAKKERERMGPYTKNR